jgi:hypothetical protein
LGSRLAGYTSNSAAGLTVENELEAEEELLDRDDFEERKKSTSHFRRKRSVNAEPSVAIYALRGR